MQEAEMEGMELEVGWVWVCVNKLVELWSSAEGKYRILVEMRGPGDGEGMAVMGFW